MNATDALMDYENLRADRDQLRAYAGELEVAMGELTHLLAKQLVGLEHGVRCAVCRRYAETETHEDSCPVNIGLALIEAAVSKSPECAPECVHETNSSPTPRTDAFAYGMYADASQVAYAGGLDRSPEDAYGMAIDFARELERELRHQSGKKRLRSIDELTEVQANFALALLDSARQEITPVPGETAALCRAIDEFMQTGVVPDNCLGLATEEHARGRTEVSAIELAEDAEALRHQVGTQWRPASEPPPPVRSGCSEWVLATDGQDSIAMRYYRHNPIGNEERWAGRDRGYLWEVTHWTPMLPKPDSQSVACTKQEGA